MGVVMCPEEVLALGEIELVFGVSTVCKGIECRPKARVGAHTEYYCRGRSL
jgi:hypothetical protein